MIAYAKTILHSIDSRLWLLFTIAAVLIWLPVLIRKHGDCATRGVITYAILILMVTLFSRVGTHQHPPELLPLWSWLELVSICNSSQIFSRRAFSSGVRFFLAIW